MKHWSDLLSLTYIVLYVAFIVAQWILGFSWILYVGVLFFVIGIQVIHHNHIHLGIWNNKRINNFTNLTISVLTAVPSAMMYGGHLKNHHVHQHGPKDVTRTYRFGGDHNHLLGYVLHPFQAFSVLIPKFFWDFLDQYPRRTRFSKDLLLQVFLIGIVWVGLLALDWQKFLLFVLLPQAFGLHWLLGSNYFQHAHCDDASEVNYARNFTGAVNWFWFNIGFHTAHHDHPRAHWSTLRKLHYEQSLEIHPSLCCSSFFSYVLQVFVLSPFVPSLRSQSLRSQSLKES